MRRFLPIGILLSLLSVTGTTTAQEQVAALGPSSWGPIDTFSGRTSRRTETFEVGSRVWRIRWEIEAIPGFVPRLDVWAQSVSRPRSRIPVISHDAHGTGTIELTSGPGRFRLEVASVNGEWRLEVEESTAPDPVAEAQRAEAERLAVERAEAERLMAERLTVLVADEEREEAEETAAEQLEAERLEAERLAAELAAEQAGAEQLAAEVERLQAEVERLAAERAEAERLAAERAEAERLAAEQAEAERLAAEQAEAERLAAEQAEAERLAAEQAEAERLAAEQAEAERLAAEQAETERLAAERAEAERLEAEQLAAEKAETEQLAVAEEAEAERQEAERARAEQLEAQRLASERAEANRLERERLAAEEAEAERLAAEKAEAERLEAEQPPAKPVVAQPEKPAPSVTPVLIASTQACTGNPGRSGQSSAGGNASLTDGAAGFTGRYSRNLPGPLGVGVEAGYINVDAADFNVYTLGGQVSVEAKMLPLEICPVAGFKYVSFETIEFGGSEVDLSGWVLPIGVAIGNVTQTESGLRVLPFIIPQVQILHSSADAEVPSAFSGCAPCLLGSSGTNAEFAIDIGATLAGESVFGTFSVSVTTMEHSNPTVNFGGGFIF